MRRENDAEPIRLEVSISYFESVRDENVFRPVGTVEAPFRTSDAYNTFLGKISMRVAKQYAERIRLEAPISHSNPFVTKKCFRVVYPAPLVQTTTDFHTIMETRCSGFLPKAFKKLESEYWISH